MRLFFFLSIICLVSCGTSKPTTTPVRRAIPPLIAYTNAELTLKIFELQDRIDSMKIKFVTDSINVKKWIYVGNPKDTIPTVNKYDSIIKVLINEVTELKKWKDTINNSLVVPSLTDFYKDSRGEMRMKRTPTSNDTLIIGNIRQ